MAFLAGLRRMVGGPVPARSVSARLEGAMARRRLRGWQPPLENVNSLVSTGGPKLLARTRELVVTNGYAANACEAFAANLVGDGIKPSSLIAEATGYDIEEIDRENAADAKRAAGMGLGYGTKPAERQGSRVTPKGEPEAGDNADSSKED